MSGSGSGGGSSSGGGVIIIHPNAVGTPPSVASLLESDLETIIAALPDGDLKSALQALLP